MKFPYSSIGIGASISLTIFMQHVLRTRFSFENKLELHIKSSDAVLKNYILLADWIELPTCSEKG